MQSFDGRLLTGEAGEVRKMQSTTELVAAPRVAGSQYVYGASSREMTLSDVWAILARRRWMILSTMLTVIALAAAACLASTRMYKATAEIQVQKDSADALSLDSMLSTGSAGADSIETNITLQTEAQILQSESLALSVIEPLQLDRTADFQAKFNPIGWVLGLFAAPGIADPKGVPLEDAPGRRTHAVKVFESHLKVKAVSGTRLIDVEYYSSDPHLAAQVVNLLAANMASFNFETRHTATEEASGWLTGQLAELRKRSEDLQTQVVALQRDSQVFTLGQTDAQGHEQVYTPTLDRLQQATAHLADAQAATIMKGALYQVVKGGDPELISGLAGNSLSGASPGVANSLTMLQELRAHEAETEAQLSELSDKFGPSYPRLTEMKANLAATEEAIREESQRIAGRVKNDYAVAQTIEDQDRGVFEQARRQAESLNSKAVEYEMVRQEAAQSRTLYESMLGRLKEADLVAGLHSSNITVVDKARVAARPSKPNPLLFAAGGILGGLILGICGAMVFDAMDSRIQDLSEMQALGSQAPIGYLPFHKQPGGRRRLRGSKLPLGVHAGPDEDDSPGAAIRWRSMVAASEPRSAYTEALRTLRTSLMQSNHRGPAPQVVLVTSSVPGEGKSMLSVNLAVVYAQSGKRVLLVDGDLRTPTIHHRLGLLPTKGLGSLLTRQEGEAGVLEPIHIAARGTNGFDFMPVGPVPAYPAELLASDEMAEAIHQWRTQYDYVLIDGAPLLPVTDSALLSRHADFTLVVARHTMTDRRSLGRTCQILISQGVRRMGVVLNGVKAGSGANYRQYDYQSADYVGGQLSA